MPEVVELSNLNRQVLFTEQDVGRPKVDVALERLRSYNSDITITSEAQTITGPTALAALADQFDVVVVAADQPQEIRSWTNQACVKTGTAWVHSGYSGPQIYLGLYRPGIGPCYDCAGTTEQERLAGPPSGTPMPSPAGGDDAGNAVSAGIAGNLAAHGAMSLITSVPQLPVNREYEFNLVNLDHNVALSLDKPQPDCLTCGQQATSM